MDRLLRVVVGALAFALLGAATMFTMHPSPADAGEVEECYDFEDWIEKDLFFDDPHHMWEEGPHPEVQEPAGEWVLEGVVQDREGTNHGSLLHFFTDDSGEHPPCDGEPGGGGFPD